MMRPTFDDGLKQAEVDLAVLAAIDASDDDRGPTPDTDRAYAVLARDCLAAWIRRASWAEAAVAKLQNDTALLTMRALKAEQMLADSLSFGDVPPHSAKAQGAEA